MKIKLQDKEFDLDVEKAKELGLLKEVVVHRIGNKYENIVTKDIYLLSSTGDGLTLLVSLSIGVRYVSFGVKTENIYNISAEEFSKLTGGYPERFSLVEVEIKVKGE